MGANLSLDLDSQDYIIDTSLPQIPGMNLPPLERPDLDYIALLIKNAKGTLVPRDQGVQRD